MITVRRPTSAADLLALDEILQAEQLGGEPDDLPCWVVVHEAPSETGKVVGGVIANFDYGDYGDSVPPGHGNNHAFIHEIAVLPGYRRQRAGQALMLHVVEGAKAAGRKFLVLMPQERDPDDQGHFEFFRSCGLRPLRPGEYLCAYGAPVESILQHLRTGCGSADLAAGL